MTLRVGMMAMWRREIEGCGGVESQGMVQERRGAGGREDGGRGTSVKEDLCEDLKGERGQ